MRIRGMSDNKEEESGGAAASRTAARSPARVSYSMCTQLVHAFARV